MRISAIIIKKLAHIHRRLSDIAYWRITVLRREVRGAPNKDAVIASDDVTRIIISKSTSNAPVLDGGAEQMRKHIKCSAKPDCRWNKSARRGVQCDDFGCEWLGPPAESEDISLVTSQALTCRREWAPTASSVVRTEALEQNVLRLSEMSTVDVAAKIASRARRAKGLAG